VLTRLGAKEEEIYQAFFELRSEAIGEFNSGMEAPAGLDENDRDFYRKQKFERKFFGFKQGGKILPFVGNRAENFFSTEPVLIFVS
jgi:hypothetical protein